MKKYLVLKPNGMLALGIAMSLLGGCGASKKLNLKKESFVVEYGDTISTKVSEYLDKGTEKEVLKKAKFSLKVENEKDKEYPAVGEYKGTIAYEDEKVTFTVEVQDTVKPAFGDGFPKEVRVEANAVDVELAKYFTATDLSNVTMTVKGDVDLRKTGDYEVKVIATDAYKNKAMRKAKIVVVSLEDAKANGVSAYVDGTKAQSEAMKQKIEEEKKAEQEEKAQQSTENTIQQVQVPQASLGTLDSNVIYYINSMRGYALTSNGNLNYIAGIRAKEVSYCWSHTRPNGGRGIDLIDASKYRGENLAKTVIYDYTGSQEDINMLSQRIVNNWANSSSHYANMVNGNYCCVGVSTYVVVEENKYTFYTAAMFSN